MITVLCPEQRPAPTLEQLYDYADANKIEVQRSLGVSKQMVFDWIAARAWLTQPELYDAIMAHGEKQ